MDGSERCGDCVFLDALRGDVYVCRRYPAVTEWLRVDPERDWCGEHKPQPKA